MLCMTLFLAHVNSRSWTPEDHDRSTLKPDVVNTFVSDPIAHTVMETNRKESQKMGCFSLQNSTEDLHMQDADDASTVLPVSVPTPDLVGSHDKGLEKRAVER